MATAEETRKAQLDARYRAKVAARATGDAPVFTHETAIDGTGRTPDDIDRRYREKLARHGRPVAEPKPDAGERKAKAPKEESKVEEKSAAGGDAKAPDTKPEQPKPDAGERRNR